MKIKLDRNLVEFSPESPQETAEMELLWKVIVDCMKDNKKLVPIGEYIPSKQNMARFNIEGIPGGKTIWTEQKSSTDSAYFCSTCNKYMNVKAGERIPLCCGREMETLD